MVGPHLRPVADLSKDILYRDDAEDCDRQDPEEDGR